MNLHALNWAILLFSANVRAATSAKLSSTHMQGYFKLFRRASSHYFEKQIQPYLVFDDVIEMDETYLGLTKFSVTDTFPRVRWVYGLFCRKSKLTVMYYL